MTDITKKYTNGEVTVVWKPDVCIHSRICWTQLGEVFDPRKRPWVNIEGADTARIVDQVSKCPSGALSYYMNEATAEAPEVTAESVVEVVPNGPLLAYGNLTLKYADGREEKKAKVTAFCRCGQSNNKPFCDGSHVAAGFRDSAER